MGLLDAPANVDSLVGASTTGRSVVKAADAAAIRAAIGAASATSKALVAGDNIVLTDATDLAVSARFGEQGMFTSIDRTAVHDTSVTATGSTLRLSYKRATRSAAFTKIRCRTGATAAGATPTVCKMGVFSVATNGDLTRLARTANDTTLFSAAGTAYEVALDATANIVAGQLYAFGICVVTTATAPTFHGVIMSNAVEAGLNERICGSVPGQTDIISSIGFASVGDTTANPYLALVA